MDGDITTAGCEVGLPRASMGGDTFPVIAHVGVGNLCHMVDVLKEGKADAVLAANIFHFGEYTVADVKHYLATHGLPMRELANLA